MIEQSEGRRAVQEGNESVDSWDFWLHYNTALPLLGFSVATIALAVVLRAVWSWVADEIRYERIAWAAAAITATVLGYLAIMWHAGKRFPKAEQPMRELARECWWKLTRRLNS